MLEAPELRLAVALRGGVSLAVWMGGACSEIDRLRRALDESPTACSSTYRELLQAVGYGSVAVDVLAGASAGGLNAAILACSVVYGVPFDGRIRDLWLQLGDIGRLVRRPAFRPPTSLLDGDGAFYGSLVDELLRLVAEAEPPARPVRLDVVLTGTLFTPVARTRYQDLGPPLVEARNRAWFRFRHLAEGLSDFPARPPERDEAVRRLAYAARATSSFPGAFEPASIRCAPAPVESTPDGYPSSHYGAFSESRTGGESGERDLVIDGGVLDNIPVAWAARSIAAAPADRPVDRWLVYLQPVPFEGGARPQERGLPGLVGTAYRARRLKGGNEVLADDLDELEQVQRDALRRRGYRQVLEHVLGEQLPGQSRVAFLDALFERAIRAVPAYRRRAGEIEAARVRRLWSDPLPVLGVDPLGFRGTTRTPLEGREAPSRVLRALTAGARELGLGDDLPSGSPQEALAGVLHRLRSPEVLARTVSVLLDGARELGEPALDAKRELHDLRLRIEVLVGVSDRCLAVAPAVDVGLDDGVELVRRALARAADRALGWPTWDEYWDSLITQAQALAAAAGTRPTRALLGCLVGAAACSDRPREATAAVLAATELLTGPLRLDPLAETADVRFHMLSAQNQSPLVPSPDGGPLTVGDKLAGNQLVNFGAFLSARWRLNDWTWGRLDAARSLVDMVTEPRDGESALPALRRLAGLPPDSDLGQVRDALVHRLHDEILREELPQFVGLGAEPPSPGRPPLPWLSAGAALDTSALLEAGRATVLDLLVAEPRRLLLAGRLLGASAYGTLGSAATWGAQRVLDAFSRPRVAPPRGTRPVQATDYAGGRPFPGGSAR